METVAYLQSSTGGHARVVGGLTVLERRVRELAKAGVQRVLIATEPIELSRLMPIPMQFVPPGSPVPAGARVERADVLQGIEIGDDDARRTAEWKLIRGMNKSFEGPVDALINWRFSMRITRQLARRSLALTPNHVTITAIVVGLLASVLASRGGYWHVAIAGVLLELNSILDSCDGELARLRFQYSKLGQWLDNLSDDVVDNVFLIAVGHALGGVWATIGLAAAIGRVLVSLVTYVSVYRRTGTGDVFAFRWWFERDKATADDVYDPKAITTWLRSFGRRDTFVFVWMIACLVGFPYWVVVHGAVIAAVNVGLLVLHFTVYRARRVP
ncbi:MAG TPA: CDP-alcohol phosphatidyltransferase family protein [Kofleriaceae bacterium]